MRQPTLRRRMVIVGVVAALFLMVPAGIWFSLTHQPHFYRNLVKLPRDQVEAKAKHFVAGSLQLRNDIANEREWQAVFTDQEVNAWLAEDLVTHFADQIPPEVHEPRLAFNTDRLTLAFQLDQGPIRSVIWVVVRARVVEDNVLALTFEKIRAGVVPLSADRLIVPLTDKAKEHGLDVTWSKEDDLPVATIRFGPATGKSGVVLEHLDIRQGQIRLSGRSDPQAGGLARPSLPTRKVLQLRFPNRKNQAGGSKDRSDRNSTSPTS